LLATISSTVKFKPGPITSRVGRFLPEGGKKTVFSMEKTGLAKIVFAGKNRFLPKYIFIAIKYCYILHTFS